MDSNLRIRLPDAWIERSRAFAERLIQSYANGESEASRAVSCFDAERNAEMQANAKMSECAFALFAGLDPETAVHWGARPDKGYDLIWHGKRWDVKATHAGGTRLIWPITKNGIFATKPIDALVLVKHKPPNFLVRGWIGKAEFYVRKEIAGEGHKLFPGTWFVDQTVLDHVFAGGA